MRIRSLLLVVILTFALGACSSGHEGGTAGTPAAGTFGGGGSGAGAGAAGMDGGSGGSGGGGSGAGTGATTGGSVDAFSSGVPASTKLSELTETDKQKLCDALDTYAEGLVTDGALVETLCVVTAVFGAAFLPSEDAATTCEMLYDQCLMAPVMTTMEGMCDVTTAIDCDATIGEYEACVSEGIDMLSGVDLSCDDVGMGDPLSILGALPTENGPICAELEMRCPGVTASTDVAGMMMGMP